MYLLSTKHNCQPLRHVDGFPALRLLWADPTSTAPLVGLAFKLNFPTYFL